MVVWYTKRRMERTEDADKNRSKIVVFWFCGKVIAEPKRIAGIVCAGM
jgi:hypothetical protein